MFSLSKPRWPVALHRGASRARPVQAGLSGIPARAVRPLAVVVGCAAAITVAGCTNGAATGASSGATPSGGMATATAQAGPSAATVLTAAASNAPAVNSLVATLDIHATGSLDADLSGTLTEQMQPSQVVEVRTAVPSGLDAILAGDMAYLKLGALTQTTGRPWLEAPLSGLKSSTGASLAPMIQQLRASDPVAQAQMFTAATDARETGTGVISGVPTTQYTGSYSLAAGLAKLTPDQRAGLQSDLASSGITTTDFTVWVDSKNQVRKISLVESGKSTRITIVLVIISLNQAVQIQLPPAGEVTGVTGVTSTPTPRVTGAPVPSTPMPVTTSTPAPSITSTPTPVTTSQPTAPPTIQPSHW